MMGIAEAGERSQIYKTELPLTNGCTVHSRRAASERNGVTPKLNLHIGCGAFLVMALNVTPILLFKLSNRCELASWRRRLYQLPLRRRFWPYTTSQSSERPTKGIAVHCSWWPPLT
jgi:hypothetical protein